MASTFLDRAAIALVLLSTSIVPAQAQIVAAPNDAGTVVTPSGNNFNISGGATAGNNLFHSFQRFGLDANQTANFRADLANPSIQNILGRVVGGDPSVINGTIQVTGSNANLYLMNPAGIIFGAKASLNVQGSFVATTANGIGFGADKWFSATGANNYADLIGNPTSLAFTMSQPGAIVNNSAPGNLSVNPDSTLVLAGGTVVSSSAIKSGGGITIAAVPGSSLVRISQTGSLLSLEVPVAIGSSRLNSLPADFSVLSLPQLLTDGNAGSTYGLTVDSNGQVTLTSSNVPVKSGDVVTTDVDATSSNNYSILRKISVFANNGISLGGVGLGTDNFALGTVKLTARNSNITVQGILAGDEGIFISTPGTFRAIGPASSRRYTLTRSQNLNIKDYPELINFLLAQGITKEQINEAISNNSKVELSSDTMAEGNVIALGEKSVIRIQHGGEATSSQLVNFGGTQAPRISVVTAPDTSHPVPFVTGGFSGFESSSSAEAIRRAFDPKKDVQDFGGLRGVRGVFVRPNQFPEGVSGSTVGIYVGTYNSQMFASLQSRLFVPSRTTPPRETTEPPTPPTRITEPPPPPVRGGDPPIERPSVRLVPPRTPLALPVELPPNSSLQENTPTSPIQASITQTQTAPVQTATSQPAATQPVSGDTAAIQRQPADRTSNPCAVAVRRLAESGEPQLDRRPCNLNPQDDAQILKILDEPATPPRKTSDRSATPSAWWQAAARPQ